MHIHKAKLKPETCEKNIINYMLSHRNRTWVFAKRLIHTGEPIVDDILLNCLGLEFRNVHDYSVRDWSTDSTFLKYCVYCLVKTIQFYIQQLDLIKLQLAESKHGLLR